MRHGGGQRRVTLDDQIEGDGPTDEELLALDHALGRLEARDTAMSNVVKLRFFAGMTNQQAADFLGISRTTADRYWTYARAWLFRSINQDR